MSSPTFFGEGSTPRVHDTRWRILQKILGATIDGAGGGGSVVLQVYQGHGDPNGVPTGRYPGTWAGGAPGTPNAPAIYQNLDVPGEEWHWDVASQAWF